MAQGFFGSIGSSPSLGINFKPFGRWDQTMRVIHNLKPAIKAASLAAQMSVCREISRRVKGHLKNQDLSWRPLSPRYLAQKEKKGYDERILLASGSYYHAIEVFTKGNQKIAFVGVKRGVYGKTLKGKKSRMQIADIAAIHEFSYNAKRRRPLWNPTIRELGGAKGIKKLYEHYFYNQLKRRGIPLTKVKKIRW